MLCTPRAKASSGQLRRGQDCCWFYLITLIAARELAGHSTQSHLGAGVVRFPQRCVFPSSPPCAESKITIRLAGDECPASNSLEARASCGLRTWRGLDLSSFGTSQPLLRDARGILATVWKSYALVVPRVYKEATF